MIHEEIHIGSLQKKIVVQIQKWPGASLFSSMINLYYRIFKKQQWGIYEEDNHTEILGIMGIALRTQNYSDQAVVIKYFLIKSFKKH